MFFDIFFGDRPGAPRQPARRPSLSIRPTLSWHHTPLSGMLFRNFNFFATTIRNRYFLNTHESLFCKPKLFTSPFRKGGSRGILKTFLKSPPCFFLNKGGGSKKTPPFFLSDAKLKNEVVMDKNS